MQTNSIKIYITTYNGKGIAQVTTGVTLAASNILPGTISNLDADPITHSEVQQPTSYQIKLKPTHALPNSCIIFS
jgi:hypothetical protein